MDIVNYQCNDFITEVNNMGNQRTQPSVTLLHAKLGWQWLIKTPVMATIVYNIVVLCKFRRIPILIVFLWAINFINLWLTKFLTYIFISISMYIIYTRVGHRNQFSDVSSQTPVLILQGKKTCLVCPEVRAKLHKRK